MGWSLEDIHHLEFTTGLHRLRVSDQREKRAILVRLGQWRQVQMYVFCSVKHRQKKCEYLRCFCLSFILRYITRDKQSFAQISRDRVHRTDYLQYDEYIEAPCYVLDEYLVLEANWKNTSIQSIRSHQRGHTRSNNVALPCTLFVEWVVTTGGIDSD